MYLKWIWGWCSINRLLCSSICPFVVQTIKSEWVQSTSLTFIGRNKTVKAVLEEAYTSPHDFDHIPNFLGKKHTLMQIICHNKTETKTNRTYCKKFGFRHIKLKHNQPAIKIILPSVALKVTFCWKCILKQVSLIKRLLLQNLGTFIRGLSRQHIWQNI